jgi:hypothetical protein
VTGQPCRKLRKREPGRFRLWITQRGRNVLPIIRHMGENQNLLSLGSLWDTEIDNAQLDEKREQDRDRRASLHFRDALLELLATGGISVLSRAGVRPVHVRRVGLMWLDGVMCGTTDRVIVHLTAIHSATDTVACSCPSESPRVFELVPFGAVLRELERRSVAVTAIRDHGGIHGRIGGVWRDAVTLNTARGRVVLPVSEFGVVVVGSDRL